MRSWDGEVTAAEARPARANRVSGSGRVNLEGADDCPAARTYTRRDPEFRAALEPGVRRLVLTLVEAFDCITYSSCEGHPAPGASAEPSPRHAGVLPRDAAEYERLVGAFGRAARRCNLRVGDGAVRVTVVERTLTSEGMAAPCLEIVFACERGEWPAYFSRLEEVYEAFLTRLAEEAPGGAAGTLHSRAGSV